jgi:Holliday junction resolvase RusA-like endonuclease
MRIVVYGIPAPQGSKRPIRNKHTGKIATVENSPNLAPWRQDVKHAAEAVLEDLGRPSPFQGAVVVRMVFSMPRPASVKRNKRPWPSVAPDVLKLGRAVEDALTAAGVWRDDCLVVEYTRLAKVYCGEDPEALDRPGVLILIGELVDSEAVTGTPPGKAKHGTTPAGAGTGDQHS